MKLAIPSCIALLLITTSGIHRSSWSGLSAEEELGRTWTRACVDARTKLNEIPNTLGSWLAVKPGPVYGDLIFERKEDYPGDSPYVLTRQYENLITGENIILLIMFGKTRHVSVHSLGGDCYSQIRYSLHSRPEPYAVSTGAGSAVFRSSRFMKINMGKEKGLVRIFWAWSEGGEWGAPEYPRIAFEDATGLYKMYVFTPIDGDAENSVDGDHPGIDFLEAFIATTDSFQSRSNSPE